jgi:hypothetical protein
MSESGAARGTRHGGTSVAASAGAGEARHRPGRRRRLLATATVVCVALGLVQVVTPQPGRAAPQQDAVTADLPDPGTGANTPGEPVDPKGPSRFVWKERFPSGAAGRGGKQDKALDVNWDDVSTDNRTGSVDGSAKAVYFPKLFPSWYTPKGVPGAADNRIRFYRYLACENFGGSAREGDDERDATCGAGDVKTWTRENCDSRGWTANTSDFDADLNTELNRQNDTSEDSPWYALGKTDIPWKLITPSMVDGYLADDYYYWTAQQVETNRWTNFMSGPYGHWMFCERFHSVRAEAVDDSPVATIDAKPATGGIKVDAWGFDRNSYNAPQMVITVDGVAKGAYSNGNVKSSAYIRNTLISQYKGDSGQYMPRSIQATYPAAAGTHEVCILVQNVRPTAPISGSGQQGKACTNVTVTGGPTGNPGSSISTPDLSANVCRVQNAAIPVPGLFDRQWTEYIPRSSVDADGNVITWNEAVPHHEWVRLTGTGSGEYGYAYPSGGNIVYAPNKQALLPSSWEDLTDEFTYTVTNEKGQTGTATVTINLPYTSHCAPANPVAQPDLATTHRDPINVDVIANDYDPDGWEVRLTSVGGSPRGTAVVLDETQIRYTPPASVPATFDDRVTYTVCQPAGRCTTGTLTVRVTNVAPTGQITLPNHVLMGGRAINVLSNVSDFEDDDVLISSATATSTKGDAGTLSCTAVYSCLWTPPKTTSGVVTLRVTLIDDLGATTVLTPASISVIPVRPS